MIIFEEELKKFHKSLEMGDAESDIYEKQDEDDVVEVLLNLAQNSDSAATGEGDVYNE